MSEPENKQATGKNPHAVAMGRLAGQASAKRRAETTTPEERREAARKAARARWGETDRGFFPPQREKDWKPIYMLCNRVNKKIILWNRGPMEPSVFLWHGDMSMVRVENAYNTPVWVFASAWKDAP